MIENIVGICVNVPAYIYKSYYKNVVTDFARISEKFLYSRNLYMLSSVQRNRRNHKKRISRYFTVGSESWFSVLRIEPYSHSKEAKACTNSPRTEALW